MEEEENKWFGYGEYENPESGIKYQIQEHRAADGFWGSKHNFFTCIARTTESQNLSYLDSQRLGEFLYDHKFEIASGIWLHLLQKERE